MDIADRIIIAAVAALLAGIISLLIYLVDRSKEITKARKEWIEGLRNDISIFLGNTTTISRLWQVKSEAESLGKFRRKNKEMYVCAKTSFHRALLHLNENEAFPRKEVEDLRTALKNLYEDFFKGNDCSDEVPLKEELEQDVRRYARILFAKEWDKVKNGEPIYRYVTMSICGLVLGVIPPIVLVWLIWIGYPPALIAVIVFYFFYIASILIYFLKKMRTSHR